MPCYHKATDSLHKAVKIQSRHKTHRLELSCMKFEANGVTELMPGLVGFLLLVIYLGGGWKFWSGFKRTNFSQNRIVLTLLWPALLTSKSYRQNFMKALKS